MIGRKGQIVAVEQLIYFGIGISILIATVGGFNFVEERMVQISKEDQFMEVGELVLTNIQNAYIQGSNLDADYEITLQIPKTLGDDLYHLEFVDNERLVIVPLRNPDNNQSLNLMGLNESITTFSGKANSVRPSVKIKYNPSGIISIENE